jgi:photosystem II stability/assembly factor-like uncharacterized protein
MIVRKSDRINILVTDQEASAKRYPSFGADMDHALRCMKFADQFSFRLWFDILLSIVLILNLIIAVPSVARAQEKRGLSDDLLSVSFPNEKEGWVCGRWGLVLHTADGGLTWSRQETHTDFTLASIFFVDTKNGWAVGDGGTIIHTDDGGNTWVKQKSPVPFYLMGVHSITPLKGWIVTEKTHILHTTDGGKIWSVQFKDVEFNLRAISFSDTKYGWAVGEYGYIYRTSNGGATWKKNAGFFGLSEETGEIQTGKFLFDVVAVDHRTVWAVGIDGYVIKTTNGGASWQEVVCGKRKTRLFSIATDKNGTIVVGGKGTLVVSTDQGKTWQEPKVEPPITYSWINGIAYRGLSNFVAVGQEEGIYRTDEKKGLMLWQRMKTIK